MKRPAASVFTDRTKMSENSVQCPNCGEIFLAINARDGYCPACGWAGSPE
ncbi:MAG: hypothetical protein FWF85_08205 [Clostridiales bacterium]|nr:hypothetical protein [Clostridiales bacterium]